MAAILSENLSSLGIDELTKRATPGVLSKGDAAAQFELGLRYEIGKGISGDQSKADEWYCKAAKQGLARAQNKRGIYFDNMGAFCRRHLDERQEYITSALEYDKKALKWFKRAAEQGDADAQFNLALLYQEGRNGIPQDYSLAIAWC